MKNNSSKQLKIDISDIFKKNLKFGEISLAKINRSYNQNKCLKTMSKNYQHLLNKNLNLNKERTVILFNKIRFRIGQRDKTTLLISNSH